MKTAASRALMLAALLLTIAVAEADTQIQIARRLAPDELRPALAEIRLLLLQKQPQAAKSSAESLRARGITVRELVELHAQALFQMQQTAAARNASQELQNEELTPAGWNDPLAAAVLAWSTDPRDILTEARSLAASGRLPQAEQLLLNSASRLSTQPEYCTTLSRIQTDAISSLHETLRTTPEMTAARLVLAELLLKQNQTSEATKQIRIPAAQLPESDPNLAALHKQLLSRQTTD